MNRIVTAALIQYVIRDEWADNMQRVETMLRQARDQGADLAVLPEMFCQPYDMKLVPERAERIPTGRTCEKLSGWSKELEMTIVGGSIAETDENGKYYNTATVWNEKGELIATHRKVHLFDVDLPGGLSFKESTVLSAGNRITVCEAAGLKLGVAVCYDVRFPELFRLMALKGADFVALPGAFNNISGPAHWEMLIRNRAAENTFYVAGVSGLSPDGSSYEAWGHSMLVDPFARILFNLGKSEGIVLGKIDPAQLEDIRSRLPVLKQRRDDLYELKQV